MRLRRNMIKSAKSSNVNRRSSSAVRIQRASNTLHFIGVAFSFNDHLQCKQTSSGSCFIVLNMLFYSSTFTEHLNTARPSDDVMTTSYITSQPLIQKFSSRISVNVHYTYIYTHTHIYMCVYIYIYTHMYTHTYIYM